MRYEGTVYLFGNDVNTDEIIAARYLNTTDPAVLAANLMEDVRAGFGKNVQKGGIMAAGRNFGCGSSREHAPIAIKAAGISCVIAESFARIFFRNAINIGLPIVECRGISSKVKEGERIDVNLKEGFITLASGEKLEVTPFPAFMEEIVRNGGWIPYLKAKYGFAGTPSASTAASPAGADASAGGTAGSTSAAGRRVGMP
jgi:3-isopropylmalate/(R)-2-methylmalate dehydratase small subunit